MRSHFYVADTASRSSSTRPTIHPPQNTWHPSRGIIFFQSSARDPCESLCNSHIDVRHDHNETPDEPNNDILISNLNFPEPELELTYPIPAGADGSTIEDVIQNLNSSELPESTSSYKMTHDLFKAAKDAEPGSFDSYWSHQLYRGPSKDGQSPKPTVHYCKSKHTTERVLKAYFMNQTVLGFDIEWNPGALKHMGARQNVSLIQIASEERIALFHLALYPKGDCSNLVSPSLKNIMEDPKITKVGVAIKADCTRLRKFLNIDSQGLFELSHLFKLIKYSTSKNYKLINKSLVSLAIQVQEHLHLPLFKGGDVRASNWSQKLLLNQIVYAAADSYAAVQLYNTMECKRKIMDPMPPRPYHAELNLPIRVVEGVESEGDAGSDEADLEDTLFLVPPTKRKYMRSTTKQSSESDALVGPGDNLSSSSSLLKTNKYPTASGSAVSTSDISC